MHGGRLGGGWELNLSQDRCILRGARPEAEPGSAHLPPRKGIRRSSRLTRSGFLLEMVNKMKFATLCYVRSDGYTLMIHRTKKMGDMHAGKWNGLGGKLEPGETPEECARREIAEESGLIVKDLHWKGLLTFPQFSNQEDWYAFVFVAGVDREELIDSAEGELRWIPDLEIQDLNLWEGDRIFLPWLDQPGFFSAKFTYQDKKLLTYQVNFYT